MPVSKPAARPIGVKPKVQPVDDENEQLVEEAEDETTAESEAEVEAEPEAEGEGFEEDDDNESYNLNDVDENAKASLLKPGIWDGYVEEVTFSHSQTNNNPMWTWVCALEFEQENQKTGEIETRERRLYYHTVWNNEAGLARIKRTIKRLKLDEDQGGPIVMSSLNPRRDCDKIAGAPARFRIRNRKYEGEFRNNVVDILPPKESDEE